MNFAPGRMIDITMLHIYSMLVDVRFHLAMGPISSSSKSVW